MSKALCFALLGTSIVAGATEPSALEGQLGIAEVEIQESSTVQAIVGRDADGRVVATYVIELGPFEMTPYFADGLEGIVVPGRRITIDVRGQRSYSESADYPALTKLLPGGAIGLFVQDPRVAPSLAGWGITYRQPAPELLSTAIAVGADEPWVGDPGYSSGPLCNEITCGYIFGVAGTQQLWIDPGPGLTRVRSTDPNSGCADVNCGVCGGGTAGPAAYAAMITANPDYGDLPRESYLAQLCLNEPHLVFPPVAPNGEPFFEIKACRQVPDPDQCPSGGYVTSCGCTPSARAVCKPCDEFASGLHGHEPYIPPFGAIDAGFGAGDPLVRHGRRDLAQRQIPGHNAGGLVLGNYLQFSYAGTCYPAGNYCVADSQCCDGCSVGPAGWGTCN